MTDRAADGPRPGGARWVALGAVLVVALAALVLVNGPVVLGVIWLFSAAFLAAYAVACSRPFWTVRGDQLLFPPRLFGRPDSVSVSDVADIERVITSEAGRPKTATYNLVLRSGIVRRLAVRDLGPPTGGAYYHLHGHEELHERSALALAAALGHPVTERQDTGRSARPVALP